MTLRQSDVEVRLEKSKTRRGVGRRELKKRGRGMKDCVDQSMAILKVWTKINTTTSLRFVTRATRGK
jgi:hypothetical protein